MVVVVVVVGGGCGGVGGGGGLNHPYWLDSLCALTTTGDKMEMMFC